MRAALLRRALARALDFADRGLARDYDIAMLRDSNQAVRRVLLSKPDVSRREYGAYVDARSMTPPMRGEFGEVNLPRPPSVLRGNVTMHHTHPTISPETDFALPPGRYSGLNPFSDSDFRWLAEAPRRVRGSFAHEAEGGGTYAERTGRLRARPSVFRALERGKKASGRRMVEIELAHGPDYNSQAAAAIALGRAAKRVGLLRRYGYRPSTPEAADALDAMAPTMTRAEREALDVMHSTIYGLSPARSPMAVL